MASEKKTDSRYFASLPDDEIGAACVRRLEACRKFLDESGIASRRLQSWRTYYGLDPAGGDGNTTAISRRGEQGELAHVKVNHYGSLAQSLLNLTTESPPPLVAEAVNSDSESLSQSLLADGLLQAYEQEKDIDQYAESAAESAVVMDEGYVQVGWEPSAGEKLPDDDPAVAARDAALLERQMNGEEMPDVIPDLHAGDIFLRALTAFDVVNPPGFAVSGEPPYRFVRVPHVRHDLAAQHPALADKILSAKNDEDTGPDLRLKSGTETDFDQVYVWTLLHKRTPACPNGKLVEFINADIVLFVGPLPYKEPYVFRCAPREMIGVGVGYTSLYDLLGLSDAYNALTSIPISNLESFGVGALFAKTGSNLNYKQLGQGKAFIEGDEKPEPIQFPPIPDSTFVLREQIRGDMETLSGVNATSRGNAPANLKSGAALVFMDSKTQQYARGLQKSYAKLRRDIGNAIVDLLKQFATSPRTAVLAGKAKAFTLQTFTNEDLEDVRRVVVKTGNPLQRSVAGRLELAQMLLTSPAGRTLNADQILQLVTTGQLDPLLEGPQAELLTIKSENESLAQGAPRQAVLTDRHRVHILEHKAVLATPGARENPKVVSAVLAHIQEHLNLLVSPDPAVQAVLGIIGEAPAMAAPPPGAPPDAAAGLPGGASNAEPQLPNEPQMPINPATGDRAEAPMQPTA